MIYSGGISQNKKKKHEFVVGNVILFKRKLKISRNATDKQNNDIKEISVLYWVTGMAQKLRSKRKPMLYIYA